MVNILKKSKNCFSLILLLVISLVYFPQLVIAEAQGDPINDPINWGKPDIETLKPQMQADGFGANVVLTKHPNTGLVTFVSMPDFGRASEVFRATLPTGTSSGSELRPEEIARQFFARHGMSFGLKDPTKALQLSKEKTFKDRGFARFRQYMQGVPVFGGEAIVQTTPSLNAVAAVTSNFSPDETLNPTPVIAEQYAANLAIELTAKTHQVSASKLTASTPELWIFNPALIRFEASRNQLVWRIEISAGSDEPIRELVLIDANTGLVAFNYNQIEDVKQRKVYDNNNTTTALPGASLVRTEGSGASGITEADNVYDYLGDVYDFYWNYHGRDSINGAGMTLTATVRYCSPTASCPYVNAFWNGQQMVFGQGFGTDDVTGHELTHGVTQYESGLIYAYQSGAINESFSDIWGEFIDLVNGRGNDTANMRWIMGEDISYSGLTRNMKDPASQGYPDKMTSSNYVCRAVSDNGGVHSNSGILNKAAYLMVDGDTFNGQTVTGLGITKVAKIMYEAQSNLLFSSSSYATLYTVLQTACSNLTGTSGITSADCQQVKKALDAVEMNQTPSCAAAQAPLCDTTNVQVVDVLTDTVVPPNWKFYPSNIVTGSLPITSPWAILGSSVAPSAPYVYWGRDITSTSDSYIKMLVAPVNIPTNAYLHFKHTYELETSWDGGVLEYSINGGSSWVDAGSLFTHNAPNVLLNTSGNTNPLAGRYAFSGGFYSLNTFPSSRVNLATLVGQNVLFRFRLGTNSSIGYVGWLIDDIRIYRCLPIRAFVPNTRRSAVSGW